MTPNQAIELQKDINGIKALGNWVLMMGFWAVLDKHHPEMPWYEILGSMALAQVMLVLLFKSLRK